MKKLTFIVPVFNEANSLHALYEKLDATMAGTTGYDWDLLLVNDGSRDNSWEVIRSMAEASDRIKGVCLSRNFGKEMALTAGVESAVDADAVICMDADLQHPPALIPEFLSAWEQGYEIVAANRESCEDYSTVKKLGSRAFYAVMRYFSELETPPNTTDFRLLDRKVVEAFRTFPERSRMFRGLIDWMGFRKKYIPFRAPARHDGAPTYSLRKLVNLALNSFTSFSILPLRLTCLFGVGISLATAFLLLFMAVTEALKVTMYTSMAYFMVFNTLLIGIVLFALGLVAIYVGNIQQEVVKRPLYIVRERAGGMPPTSPRGPEA